MFFLEDLTYVPNCTLGTTQIPGIVGTIVSLVYMAIRVGIPVILLIVGMIDLGKAVVAQKDDEIKKAQGLLVKKILAAVLVFVLLTLIKFAIGLVDKNTANIWTCVDALLNYNGGGAAAQTTSCVTVGGSCVCPDGYTGPNGEGICTKQ